MTRDFAEVLSKSLVRVLKGKLVVLVIAHEWENFVPHVDTDCYVEDVEIVCPDGTSNTLTVRCNFVSYRGLVNPGVDGKTVHFYVMSSLGQVRLSFTRQKKFTDGLDLEILEWIKLKHVVDSFK